MPVSREDLEKHPWLAKWDKVDTEERLDILRIKTMELENLLGTASVILVTGGIFIFILVFVTVLGSSGGAVSMDDVGKVSGIIKQFTGK